MLELKQRLERLADLGTPRGDAAVWRNVLAELNRPTQAMPVETHARRAPRVGVVAASVTVVLALLGAGLVVVLTRADSNSRTSVATGHGPASTQAALGSEPTHTVLAYTDDLNAVKLSDVDSGRTQTVVSGPGDPGRCNTCQLVQRGDAIFYTSDGHVYLLNRVLDTVRDLGPGTVVFAASDPHAVWVADGPAQAGSVTKFDEHGTRTEAPRDVPGGYQIAFEVLPKEVNGQILLQRGVGSHVMELWDPATGRITHVRDTYFIVDTYQGAGTATSILASVPVASCQKTPDRCPLTLTNAATGHTRAIDPPPDAVAFIGGGAFSPDGHTLAAFVGLPQQPVTRAVPGPQARLVLIDTTTGTLHEVRDGQVTIGEGYGFATWDPTGTWLFFGALSDHLFVHRAGTPDAVPLNLPARYTTVAIAASPGTSLPSTAAPRPDASSPTALTRPVGLAFGVDGSIYIADEGAGRVIKVSADGTARIAAGAGAPRGATAVRTPSRVAVTADGTLYIADKAGDRIDKLTPSGTLKPYAGTGQRGYSGDGGPATAAQINEPSGLVLDPSGALFFTEGGNDVVRKVSPDGTISTFAGTPHLLPVGPLSGPEALARDHNGNLYVFSMTSKQISRVSTNGTVTPITKAQGAYLSDMATDPQGNIILADYATYAIERLNPDGTTTPLVWSEQPPNPNVGPKIGGLARPSAVAVTPDGSLIFSNDGGNGDLPAVFRISLNHNILERILPPRSGG